MEAWGFSPTKNRPKRIELYPRTVAPDTLPQAPIAPGFTPNITTHHETGLQFQIYRSVSTRHQAGCPTSQFPTRWTLPARWYTFDFPTHKPLIHFIVLDSNMPRADGTWQHGHDFTLKPEEQAEQLHWFETQLQKPRTTPYLGVLGHHPIYSNGPHGDHPVLIREWDTLFRKYKVDLYMAGHDHDLQHLELEGHPTTHFLSGGGRADLYVLKVDGLDRGPYAQQVHGFSHLSVTPKSLELRHLDADGRLLYGITRTPAGIVKPLGT